MVTQRIITGDVSMNRAQIIETMARRLAEVHIRSARRWDTDPARVDEMLPRSIDACWQDRNFTDAATAVLSALEAASLVVVPREPTPAMTSASYMLYMREKSRDAAWSGKKNGHLIYDAMIKAHLFDIDGLIEEGIWRYGQLFNFQEMDDEVLLDWAHEILDDFPEVEQRPTDDVLLEKIKIAAAKEWKMT
jgi:hypothetical protein